MPVAVHAQLPRSGLLPVPEAGKEFQEETSTLPHAPGHFRVWRHAFIEGL